MQNYTECSGRGNPTDIKIRSNLVDTYWIIPEYETTPYCKLSFTRQDCRTFKSMFKDSRLIWAGRQPVQGIVEITTPQGRVNITPPSTITNIITVPATVSDIATVQEVAHV